MDARHRGRFLIAARVEGRVGDDRRVSLAGDDREDVAAVERADRAADDLGECARRLDRADHVAIAVDEREHRQVVVEPLAAPQDQVERLLQVFGVLDRGRDREEFIEQIAAGLEVFRAFGHAALEGRVRGGELGGHVVEGGAELADLVARIEPGARLEVALRDRHGRLGQLLDGPREPVGHHVRAANSRRDDDAADRDQGPAEPRDRRVRLGDVDLRDQPPRVVPDRPVDREDRNAAAVVGLDEPVLTLHGRQQRARPLDLVRAEPRRQPLVD